MLNIYGTDLPVELYLHICRSLGPPTPDAIKVLANLLAVNSYVRTIVISLSTWKELYEMRYTHDVSEREEDRRRRWGNNYCRLYCERRTLDNRALRIVDEIRTQVFGRSQRALIIAKELSFDVWDALDEEVNLLPPTYFRDTLRLASSEPSPDSNISAEPHALPRSYWAKAAQGVIARYWAVMTWHRAARDDRMVNEEEVLCAWSAFFGWSPQLICREFDYIARECRAGHLSPSRRKVVWNRNDPGFDLKRACGEIIEAMKYLDMLRDDFNIEDTEHVLNSYPHVILMSERNYALTTFAKTWIFLAICRRLGLVAYAAAAAGSNSPICVVRTLSTEHGKCLVDFASKPVLYLAADRDVPALERILDDSPSWLLPLSMKWFFIHSMEEAARNLALYNEYGALQWSDTPHETCLLASHAAQCALATTTAPLSDAYIKYPENISDVLPLDGHAVLLDALIMNAPSSAVLLDKKQVAAVKAAVQRLEDPDQQIMYRSEYPGQDPGAVVGKVVIHNEEPEGDSAIIVGWKLSKEDSQQVRYKIATSRGIEYWGSSEFRYVGLSPVHAQILHQNFPQLGQFVEDVSFSEVDSEGDPMRCLLTAEMRMLYPEDDILGVTTPI